MADEQDTVAAAVIKHQLMPQGLSTTFEWVCSCGTSGKQSRDSVARVRWWANHVGSEVMMALKMQYEYGVRQVVTRELDGKQVVGTSITTAGTDPSYDYAMELLDERQEWAHTTRHGVTYGSAELVRRVASGWETAY